ncbi:winged helix DNA-binding domain-containing protein [Dacryopinax primogenitus]|uniref:Winged helix DNA-binding domain-containing protein n=1 Tax=Dacryopinax primogenitus (strain DJM 731) TaxID=1858805 RepID=M5FT83_DACPD|nr:winged helix DNA-binding domain-containing protein [Dacryopinax primogenitus]EJT99218.1 winged helix DNA-binding domain-containing protein [Dacryopinax primogenitus]
MPPPGAYMPYDPADPESYLPPPGPPMQVQGMDIPLPGYAGPPPPPWMLPPPGYMPPPPFVPPYAQPYPPAIPPQPNGMPFPGNGMMPGVPIPTPVTQLSFPLDMLRYYLLGQVEYYFSLHNLVNDVFLRNQMDNDGWVDINVVASFNRMRTLTNDYALVRETMELSSLVEVRGERVRLANGLWQQFVMHRTPRQPGQPASGPPIPGIGPVNGEADGVTTATNTAPGSETASGSAATTLSVPEEEGEKKGIELMS